MATKKRQFARSRQIKNKRESERIKVYNETLKQVQKTNERLESLSKRYESGTWATRKLVNRLSGDQIKAFEKGRVKIPKNATTTQLKGIQKATRQFLESKTSTKKGISEVSNAVKKGMLKAFEIEGEDVDMKDIEGLYQMMTDDDFTKSDFEDKIGASRMDRYILDAKEKNQSLNEFIETLEANEFSLDEDLRNKASNIYSKYVKNQYVVDKTSKEYRRTQFKKRYKKKTKRR